MIAEIHCVTESSAAAPEEKRQKEKENGTLQEYGVMIGLNGQICSARGKLTG